jgi:LPXTG-motif cell wall-anchored protein
VIRATAAAVEGSYNSAYTDVTFSFSVEPGPTTPAPSTPTALASTGFDAIVPFGLGFTALIAGAGAVLIARRRNQAL